MHGHGETSDCPIRWARALQAILSGVGFVFLVDSGTLQSSRPLTNLACPSKFRIRG